MTLATSRLNDYWRASATVTAVTACLLVGATSAHAATPSGAPSVTVAYGDLNLDTVQGTHTLYARIASAAREVCGGYQVDIRDLNALAFARSCQAQAISRAVSDVHSPTLAAVASVRVRHG